VDRYRTCERKVNGCISVYASQRSDRKALTALLHKCGFQTLEALTLEEVKKSIAKKADLVLITDELLRNNTIQDLKEYFKAQPTWSYYPCIILSSSKEDPAVMWKILNKLEYSGQFQILERPVHTAELISAVHSGLVSRLHQYRVRDELRRRKKIEEELREESNKKNRFLAVLGHELRNPLAVLDTSIGLLEKDPPPARRGRYQKKIKEQTTQLKQLVDELLEVSRISREDIALKPQIVEAGLQMRKALESVQDIFKKKTHRIWLSTPSETLHISADPLRLQQIFINLLNNAITYTPAGESIWFSATVKEDDTLEEMDRYSAELERSDGGGEKKRYVEISVKDTGKGITPERIETIFEPFKSSTMEYIGSGKGRVGLGIGLSIVKHLTELHGGTVNVCSDGDGKGSEFTLRFPLAGPEARKDDPEKTAVKKAAENPTAHSVLLVEDNQDFAELLEESLEEEGHRVETVHTGREALDKIDTYVPEYMILDVGLSDMDGFSLGDELRRRESLKNSVFIALSGFSLEIPLADTPFDYYVVKGGGIDRIFEILSS